MGPVSREKRRTKKRESKEEQITPRRYINRIRRAEEPVILEEKTRRTGRSSLQTITDRIRTADRTGSAAESPEEPEPAEDTRN